MSNTYYLCDDDECQNYVLTDDSWDCGVCDDRNFCSEPHLDNHRTTHEQTCETCGDSCDETVNCQGYVTYKPDTICEKVLCSDCRYMCVSCDEWYCEDHIKWCDSCEDHYCDDAYEENCWNKHQAGSHPDEDDQPNETPQTSHPGLVFMPVLDGGETIAPVTEEPDIEVVWNE